jgi:hypothetical protein
MSEHEWIAFWLGLLNWPLTILICHCIMKFTPIGKRIAAKKEAAAKEREIDRLTLKYRD